MKPFIPFVLALFFVCLSIHDVMSQEATDSTVVDTFKMKEKKGSIFSGRPGKSMLMSLVIPGAGQIYNKSYLRVPFVWGAVGGMGGVMYYNIRQYNCLSDAYKASVDNEPYVFPDHCDAYDGITDPGRLKALRDDANNARQLSIVGFSLVWLANGIDAFVNAHLKEFDMNEDLSIDFGTRSDNDPNSPMRFGVFVQF